MADVKDDTNEEATDPVDNTRKTAKKAARPRVVGRKRKGGNGPKRPLVQKPQRPFPRVAFSVALQVAQKIKELNGGNPWPPADVAAAVAVGPSTGRFYYITAAARDFGLTVGTRDSERIELTPFGKAIVYAPDPATERAKKIEAFFKVEVFKKVFEHYNGATLPDMKYLGNTLENQFGVIPAFHDEFVKLFRENCKDVGLDEPTTAASALAGGSQGVGGGSATIVLAEPRAGGKPKRAFIIMPFGERTFSGRDEARPKGFFEEVLRSLLTPAGVNAGFAVETAKRQGSDVIQSTIINELLDADLVIADLTDHNPNVLFELGLRIAEEKPVALIKTSDTGRIFDVDNMLRVMEYNANLWPSTIEIDVPLMAEHIKAAWEARTSGQTYMKILRRGISDMARQVG
jgi:hypothetical protein